MTTLRAQHQRDLASLRTALDKDSIQLKAAEDAAASPSDEVAIARRERDDFRSEKAAAEAELSRVT